MTNESLPLATLFRETLLFLARRDDAVLFGAHAVNAYCEIERMSHDIDVLSTDAATLAEDLRNHLAATFGIATRIRELATGRSYRVYQQRSPKNRHLVDIRQFDPLPTYQLMEGIKVAVPSELIALKLIGMVARQGQPKAGTDLVDIQRLLLAFPELKSENSSVAQALTKFGASEKTKVVWHQIVQTPLHTDEDEGW